MRIAVVGTGYVGLVTGTCLASTGNTVTCIDVDAEKVAMLNEGRSPIFEAGLEPMIQRHHADGRLHFTTDAADAIADAEIVFIAVGTPSDVDGSADLSAVLKVAETVGDHIDGYTVVIVKSTVPVGTCDKVRDTIAARTEEEFDVVSNPEFLKEGTAVRDFMSPSRVVIGTDSERAADLVSEVYSPFMRRNDRIVLMDVRSSEMTKYASNAMLATKISFMNEIANICEAVGADVELVRTGMSLDERIGPHFIYPGAGFGGSCFPKDVRALLNLAAGERQASILGSVNEVNVRQKQRLAQAAIERFGEDLNGRTFAVWGLSFKPGTDDVREAPSLETIRTLVQHGATIRAHDPIAHETAADELSDVADALEILDDEYDALEGTDALFIHTEWQIYRSPDFERIRDLMAEPTIFDGRNLFEPKRMARRGFYYQAIGRPVETPS